MYLKTTKINIEGTFFARSYFSYFFLPYIHILFNFKYILYETCNLSILIYFSYLSKKMYPNPFVISVLCIFIYRSYDIYKEKYVTFENFELRKLIMCTTFLLVLVYVNPFWSTIEERKTMKTFSARPIQS